MNSRSGNKKINVKSALFKALFIITTNRTYISNSCVIAVNGFLYII